MLERDYSDQFQSLIQSLEWQIHMPASLARFFEETGDLSSLPKDERANQRVKVRTVGAMLHERTLPTRPRLKTPSGIYSKDFSRRGCGFIASYQLFPQETVRLLLPTLWLRLLVCRARCLGPNCYEIGGELIDQHAPSMDAFDGIEWPTSEPAIAS